MSGRWSAALLVTALLGASLPVSASGPVESASPSSLPAAALQRVEVPGAGVAATFPADWRVSTPLVARGSWFEQGPDDSTPVYAWSTIFATAGDGRWCDVDRFEDFPWSFAEHAAFLELWHVSGSLYGREGGSVEVDLPAGHAYRIAVDDELKGRSSVRYLFEYGRDRILLTCTDTLGSPEDWLSVAETIELGPRTINAIDAIVTE